MKTHDGRMVGFARHFFVLLPSWVFQPSCCARFSSIRELKKVRRQMKRKRHIKIELCFKLSLLWLFHVGHVVQNKRSALSLAWHEWFSCKGNWRMKDLRLWARVVVRTSNMKISRRRLPDYVKTLHPKACRTCCTNIFLHSTNQIIDCGCCKMYKNEKLTCKACKLNLCARVSFVVKYANFWRCCRLRCQGRTDKLPISAGMM